MTADAAAPAGGGYLLHNLLLFGRLLRRLGLEVNPGRMLDLLQALDHIDLGQPTDFYHAARSLLVHRREDLEAFDVAFRLFWRAPRRAGQARGLAGRLPAPRPQVEPPALRPPEAVPPGGRSPEAAPVLQVTQTYSPREILRRKDFADLTPAETAEIRGLMQAMLWQLGERRTRRLHPGPGARLDLRRTLRQGLRTGGEVLRWARRAPKTRPRPLVLLADISGSMERYTRLLLHFAYALAAGLDRPVETFVFGTRLTRITRQIHQRQVERALREVARAVPDWAGGTRIGQALKTFNFQWGRRVLGRGAVVLLISDGWDRGDIDLLRRETARLQRSCFRLVWLNPLLGLPGYEPLTRGMQAALPFVDDFLPVHNLASLEDLAGRLRQLDQAGGRAPARRRGKHA